MFETAVEEVTRVDGEEKDQTNQTKTYYKWVEETVKTTTRIGIRKDTITCIDKGNYIERVDECTAEVVQGKQEKLLLIFYSIEVRTEKERPNN